MPYLIVAEDHPGMDHAREIVREAHRAHLAAAGERLLASGATLADDGQTVVGGASLPSTSALRPGAGIAGRVWRFGERHRLPFPGRISVLGLAADLLPLNRGVLLIGKTTAGRIFWCERARLAFDAREDRSRVEPVSDFRAKLGLLRQPVAIDHHGIKAIWAEDDPSGAGAALAQLPK